MILVGLGLRLVSLTDTSLEIALGRDVGCIIVEVVTDNCQNEEAEALHTMRLATVPCPASCAVLPIWLEKLQSTHWQAWERGRRSFNLSRTRLWKWLLLFSCP